MLCGASQSASESRNVAPQESLALRPQNASTLPGLRSFQLDVSWPHYESEHRLVANANSTVIHSDSLMSQPPSLIRRTWRFIREAFRATKRPTTVIIAIGLAVTVGSYAVLAYMSVVHHWPHPLKILLASQVQSLPPDAQARLSPQVLNMIHSMPAEQLAAARDLASFITAMSIFLVIVSIWWFYSFVRFLRKRGRNPL